MDYVGVFLFCFQRLTSDPVCVVISFSASPQLDVIQPMHAVSVDLSFLHIYGYTVGCRKQCSIAEVKQTYMQELWGTQGQGKNPFSSCISGAQEKQKKTREERFHFDLKNYPDISRCQYAVISLTAELIDYLSWNCVEGMRAARRLLSPTFLACHQVASSWLTT